MCFGGEVMVCVRERAPTLRIQIYGLLQDYGTHNVLQIMQDLCSSQIERQDGRDSQDILRELESLLERAVDKACEVEAAISYWQ